MLAAFGFAFWPTFGYWWSVWTAEQSPFGFGYFVPPTVAFLIWARRKKIADEPKRPGSAWILLPILLAVVLQCLALIARINVLQSASFLVLAMTVPYLVWGGKVYRHIWGALAYFATMLPWPEQIHGRLLLPSQELSTALSTRLLGWTGVPTLVEGTTVNTPHYGFEVAAACSGLTILFPVISIVILTAMMLRAPWWKLGALLILAFPLSVFANAVRIWAIAMIGEFKGAELANTLHDPSGWMAVIFATFVLMGLTALLRCTEYKPEYMPTFEEETR
ncbi:MAG: exosortase/archaeosortase family protein [Fimbriimonadaceae bacterium]|nr:exosortase/archaeosortase family protein [Chthonomonadaceae bacterium]MCO5295571.1 exosortase/archaeosortase family protein [Fimbriimonadaceae bacterium]